MSNEMETRTVNSPRTGTKVSWIIAACSLAVAVYYYTASTHFTGKDGGIFGCGSPMSPNNNALGKSQCHIIENAGLHKALLFLALALISAILGTILFGMEKSTQTRGGRSRLDDEHDDDDEHEEDEHEDHDGRRSGLLSGRQERRSGGRRQEGRKPRLGDEDHEDDDEHDEEVDLRRRRSTRVTRIERQDDEPRGERAARRRDRTEATRETSRPEDETSTRETTRSQRRGSRYDADAFDDTRD